jgi:SOS-response transcriptional repressor LexA
MILMADNINEQLRAWRKKRRLTQSEAGEMLGISRNYYANLEYGQHMPQRVADQLQALGYDPNSDLSESEMRPVSLLFGQMASLPVVGTVSAGPGTSNVDAEQDEVWVPMSLRQIGGVGYVIDGDSMMPALQPGDIALFKETYQPRHGFTFLLKKEGEYRCKNVGWRSGEWVMQSLNSNKDRYPDLSLLDWQIIGILVGWYRSVGSYEKLEADPHGLRLEGPV